jgi:hypothetical protein
VLEFVLVGVVELVFVFVFVLGVVFVGMTIDGSGLKPACEPCPTSPKPRLDISSLVIKLLLISNRSLLSNEETYLSIRHCK